MLKEYPNKEYILEGFSRGFYLGFEGIECSTYGRNKSTVIENLEIANNKITNEMSLHRIAGPFNTPPFDNFKISPLALRPKSEPNKYRLLHNLSFPYDYTSVNLNIPESHSKVTYESLSSAINIIQNMENAYLAKSDLADAFRLIPLHPSQFHLTGFELNNKFYFDRCLPQGCSSSCFIFEQFSDSLKWIMKTHYKSPHVVKVLDDFLFINSTYDLTDVNLSNFTNMCDHLGIPIAKHKNVGPTQCLTFLGIELNTIDMTAKLPVEKLERYSQNIVHILAKDKTTLRELKSLLGQLQYSTSVIPVGKCFLRRMYNATIGITKPYHYIRITKQIKEDLLLWKEFLDKYNGITIIKPREKVDSISLHMFSDSCKTGYGGTFGNWFIQGSFPSSWEKFSIEFLELYPIFVLISLFSNNIKGKQVVFHCDNISIVHIINKQSSKCPLIMKLIRPMVLLMLNCNISFTAAHIPGINNKLCDYLSRSQAPEDLKNHYPHLRRVQVPPQLLPHSLTLT